MAANHRTRRLYEFGPFRLDPQERLLLRDGEAVPIIPKAFDLLVALVESSGHLVEKEELMRKLWPDSFVEEGNLAQNVSLIRKALGESEIQKYIETVPRRGYRFVGSLRAIGINARDPIVQEQVKSQIVITQEKENGFNEAATLRYGDALSFRASPRPRLSASRLKLLGAVALLGVTAVIFFWLNKPKPSASDATAKSIAVLPFKPLVARSRDEVLELGMADTLINKLSGIKGLVVRPISDVRKYARLDQNPIAAGRELGVDYVLEGNLQIEGDRTRANVRLLSVMNESAVWADKSDQAYSTIFELQDAIAVQIAGGLELQLSSEGRTQLAKHYTENTEAYRLYSMGKFHIRPNTKEGFEKSIEYFEQAIKIDPNYALAYGGLFNAYSELGLKGFLPPSEVKRKMEWGALKAVELDDTLADGHAALGQVRKWYWDWAGAEKEFKRALELDPNSSVGNFLYNAYLVDAGRLDEAFFYAKRAEQLVDPNLPQTLVAYVYLNKRDYDKAIELYLTAKGRDPKGYRGNSHFAEAYLGKGMYEEAIAEMQKVIANNNAPERWDRYPILAYAYAVAGKQDKALQILDEQKKLSNRRYISPLNFAIIYTGLGDKDRAFEYLNKSFDEGVQALGHLKIRPLFDILRSDPRYAELLRKMNLAP